MTLLERAQALPWQRIVIDLKCPIAVLDAPLSPFSVLIHGLKLLSASHHFSYQRSPFGFVIRLWIAFTGSRVKSGIELPHKPRTLE